MTEKEKREKAIDEMERDVEEALNVPICDDSGATYGYRKTTSPPTIAARLISKGYRKADEVRKEMYETLKKKRFDDREFDKFTGSRHIVLWKDVVEVFKEFGVEVDE